MLYPIIIILSNVLLIICDTVLHVPITDEEYNLVPPIYHVDSLEKCQKENKNYCKMVIELFPLDTKNYSKIWQLIEKINSSKYAYRHNILQHVVCLEDTCPEIDLQNLNASLSECYTKKYSPLGLKTEIKPVRCSDNDYDYPNDNFDYIFYFFIISYFTFILTVNLYYGTKIPGKNRIKPYLKCFLVSNHWKHLLNVHNNEKYKETQFIQGIRFYTSILVVAFHVYFTLLSTFLENPKYFENILMKPIERVVLNSSMYVVQLYFLLSGWFLCYAFQEMIGKNRISLKNILGLILVRYLRLLPPVLFVSASMRTAWMYNAYKSPISAFFLDYHLKTCKESWLNHVLFISNYTNQCIFTLWYVAADFQLFIISVFILYAIWKFKLKPIRWLLGTIFIAYIIHSLITYWYNLDVIYRLTPRTIAENERFDRNKYILEYASITVSLPTYALGLLMGYLFYKIEKQDLSNNRLLQILWFISSVGMMFVPIYFHKFEYSRLTTSLLSGVLRLMYPFGWGILIMGMFNKLGGWVRRVFAWKPVVFLSSFSYCLYVTHIFLLSETYVAHSKPVYLTISILLSSMVRVVIKSLLLAFFCYFTIEAPIAQLQKLLLPL